MFSFFRSLFGRKPSSGQLSDTVYVGNLAFSARTGDLKSLFSEYGDITEAKVIRDRNSRKSRGYGFVTFTDTDGASGALKLDGQDFKGRSLRVSYAMQKRNDHNDNDE